MLDWSYVNKLSEKAYEEGKYQNNYGDKPPGKWPIKVEDYKGNEIGE